VILRAGPVFWAKAERSEEANNISPYEQSRLFKDDLVSPGQIAWSANRGNRDLWQARIAPLSEVLIGIEHLVVIPSGAMLGIPIEPLMGGDRVAIGEKFTVSYIPSATIYAWLCEESRKRNKKEQTLLVGDPPFTKDQYAAMEKEAKTGMIDVASIDAYPDTAAFRNALVGNTKALASLPRLPATREEVACIASLSPNPLLLLGSDASEMRIIALAESGSLREYSAIHIASHALVDDENPERSALVLSQIDLPDPLEAAMEGARIYDGLITAKEIVREWELDTDLVTLSACETGLGKEVGEEGYVGFSHAFFQAGARSLLVSLWKVEDQATSLLMQRFYENYYGKYKGKRRGKRRESMSKVEALKEAKNWLKNYMDEEGHKPYEHPYYWSSFILIGARN
jgi:CHAT domain-containing protein